VQLDPSSPTAFSLVRAVSATGAWVVVSRTVGSSWELSLRRTEPGSAARVVGTVPVDTTVVGEPEVSIAPDGSSVLFETTQFSHPAGTLLRWSAATGTSAVVGSPPATNPTTGDPLESTPFSLSEDGRRILWSTSYPDTPSSRRIIVTATDARTDEVLAQHQVDVGSVSGAASIGGHVLNSSQGALDVDTGALTPETPAVDALAALYPGSPFDGVATSDDGRYQAFQRGGDGPLPPTYDLVLWDWATSTATPIVLGTTRAPWITTVTDDGAVLRPSVSPSTGEADLVLRAADAVDRTVGHGALPTFGSSFTTAWSRSSEDLRTIVYTEDTGLAGFRLVASRCS
jgi:hypothetical protein